MTPSGEGDPARPGPFLLEHARDRLQAVLARSALDLSFRAELLRDPRAALTAHLGFELPDGFDVMFVESVGDATIVLPPYVGPGGPSAARPNGSPGEATPVLHGSGTGC